jgi:S-adenosylmethionine synthetase
VHTGRLAHPVDDVAGVGDPRDARISQLVEAEFDLRPGAFRRYLDLHRPIFRQTAAYGHFGREGDTFTWERTDRAEALKAAAGLEAAPA